MSEIPSKERVSQMVNDLFDADNRFADELEKLYDKHEECVPEVYRAIVKAKVDSGASKEDVHDVKASIMLEAINTYSAPPLPTDIVPGDDPIEA